MSTVAQRNAAKLALVGSLFALLAACGSGQDTTNIMLIPAPAPAPAPSPPPPPPPPPPQATAWTGATLLLRDARALEGSYDLVTCNPPFQRAGTGPIPTGPLKAAAHIELNGTLLELHTAAMGLCTPSGWVVFVIPAARIPELPSPTRSARIDHLALCAWGPALAEPLQQLDRDQAERWVQRARSVSPGSGGTAP